MDLKDLKPFQIDYFAFHTLIIFQHIIDFQYSAFLMNEKVYQTIY